MQGVIQSSRTLDFRSIPFCVRERASAHVHSTPSVTKAPVLWWEIPCHQQRGRSHQSPRKKKNQRVRKQRHIGIDFRDTACFTRRDRRGETSQTACPQAAARLLPCRIELQVPPSARLEAVPLPHLPLSVHRARSLISERDGGDGGGGGAKQQR